jgi:hypothetical protein
LWTTVDVRAEGGPGVPPLGMNLKSDNAVLQLAWGLVPGLAPCQATTDGVDGVPNTARCAVSPYEATKVELTGLSANHLPDVTITCKTRLGAWCVVCVLRWCHSLGRGCWWSRSGGR